MEEAAEFCITSTPSLTAESSCYNWSANAEDNNDENAVFIRDRQVISAFQTNFNSMWIAR